MTDSGKGNGAEYPQALRAYEPDMAVDVRLVWRVETCEPISLRPRQRLDRAVARDKVVLRVREGVLAVEIVPTGGRRQILDFLMPGDVVPGSGIAAPLGFSLRAITGASLTCYTESAAQASDPTGERSRNLFEQLQMQLARRSIHQIMVGQLDTESRLASFLYALALRSSRQSGANLLLALPMSRDDIADYLAINHDTLSRVMSRFEAIGLIRRVNRHAIRVTDIDRLGCQTPIGALVLAALARPAQYSSHN